MVVADETASEMPSVEDENLVGLFNAQLNSTLHGNVLYIGGCDEELLTLVRDNSTLDSLTIVKSLDDITDPNLRYSYAIIDTHEVTTIDDREEINALRKRLSSLANKSLLSQTLYALHRR